MNISDLAEAKFKGNNLTITWVDTTGLRRVDNMSPRAQQHLLMALLTSPPAQAGQMTERGPFVATNFQLAQGVDGTIALVVDLAPGIAIHIALPEPLPERLKEMLGEDPSTWKGVTTQ